jgi:PAS domain S-box-containing protein
MERPSAPANLLILAAKAGETERIVTALRNGGLAVQGLCARNLRQFEELIGTGDPELILVCDYDPDIDLRTSLSLYREIDADIPLVVIADAGADPSVLIAAMRNGARDATERGDGEHLQLVVARELSEFRGRRHARQLRRRLDECEQRARQAIDGSGDSVAYIRDGVHVRANPAYGSLFGFASEEGLEGYPLLDLVLPDMQNELRQQLRSIGGLDESATRSIDLDCIRSDGSEFGARMLLSKSNLDDGEPCVRVTVENRAGAGVSSSPALTDAETGLPNRAALKEELDKRLTDGTGSSAPVALIYVGVELFAKLIHDDGLSSGLEAMEKLSASLRGVAPSGAFLARIGDDGFALALEVDSKQDLTALCAKIASEARLPAAPGTVGEKERTCGTGIAIGKPGKQTAAALMDAAFRDYLLGTAEAESRLAPGMESLPPPVSQFSQSDDYSELAEEEERRLARRIEQALSHDGFQLVYQPIVSLKGASQENYSVFLRLRDDEKRPREAHEFMAAAVGTDQMVSVDRWVIDHAIQQLTRQRELNRKANFFVNIAEQTLQQEALLIWICDQLRRYQARGNWLTVQALGDHAQRHLEAFSNLSEGLRKVKCRIAINRIGPGPDAEPTLRSLPADFARFSPEATEGIAGNESKQKRLAQLAAVARESGMKTIVTGVEDARTLTVLWSAGIDYVQGNFLQRASPTIAPQ